MLTIQIVICSKSKLHMYKSEENVFYAFYPLPPPFILLHPPHVDLTVLSVFQKAVTFAHNLTH